MSSGSTIASLKAWGMAGITLAQHAASAVASAAKKGVEELQAPPSSISCSGCGKDVSVPAELWNWHCPTPSCAARGIVHTRSVKVCEHCMCGRPELPNPIVRCPSCGKDNVVPSSNAAKHLQTAKEGVINAASAAKSYTERTLTELKSTPAVIPCSSCNTALNVPPGLFDWRCARPGCGKVNQRTDKQCTGCAAPTPPKDPNEPQPALVCPVCNASTVVPKSNLEKHIQQAAKATKELAASASAAASAEYKRLKAAPRQFNCKTCNALLTVPDYWVCKQCSSHNYKPPPEEGCVEQKEKEKEQLFCSVCSAPKPEEAVEQVLCGKCGTATDVPKTNFSNNVRKYTTTIARTFEKLKLDVTGAPYITCDACGTNVPVPQAQAGGQQQEVRCPRCSKLHVPAAAAASSSS